MHKIMRQDITAEMCWTHA